MLNRRAEGSAAATLRQSSVDGLVANAPSQRRVMRSRLAIMCRLLRSVAGVSSRSGAGSWQQASAESAQGSGSALGGLLPPRHARSGAYGNCNGVCSASGRHSAQTSAGETAGDAGSGTGAARSHQPCSYTTSSCYAAGSIVSRFFRL